MSICLPKVAGSSIIASIAAATSERRVRGVRGIFRPVKAATPRGYSLMVAKSASALVAAISMERCSRMRAGDQALPGA